MSDADTIDSTSSVEQPKRRGRKPKNPANPALHDKPPTKPGKKTLTNAQIEALHEKVSIAVIASTAGLPDAVRPTDKEIDSILLPVERIISRRVNVGAIIENPDAADALAAFAGFANYTWRTVIYPALMGRVLMANAHRYRNQARTAQTASPPPTEARQAMADAVTPTATTSSPISNEAPTVSGKRGITREAGEVKNAAPALDTSLAEEEQAAQLMGILAETDVNNGKRR